MKNKKQKACLSTKQGSALVFALIMLSVMVVIAVGSFSASVIDQKTSNDTEKSVSAFQAADTGVEKVLKLINDSITSGGSSIRLSNIVGLCTSDNRYYKDTTSLQGRTITVSFFRSDDSQISDCSTAEVNDIYYIKSLGEFGGTVRAVIVYVNVVVIP